jgi:nucleotide-binding universal stress UspA family protein
MSKVVAAIDHSDTSKPVVKMAQALADLLDAWVEVVHVVEDNDDAKHPLTLEAGPPVRHLSGDAVDVLSSVAAEEGVVAVVIGARAHSGDPRPAGHVAMVLAGLTDKPVVVVPPGSHPPERLRTVVVAMEGTRAKARALQRSIEISARAGLEIVVVHFHDEYSIPSFSDQVQHEAEAYAQEFFSRHLIGAPKMRLELRLGNPAIEVLAAIASAQAELVAVGWPRSGDPRQGAVAKEILERSPVAVLLVDVFESDGDAAPLPAEPGGSQ